MFDYVMTEEQHKLREEARAFTRWVPRELILDMDAEKIQFPHEYLREAGKRNLLGWLSMAMPTVCPSSGP